MAVNPEAPALPNIRGASKGAPRTGWLFSTFKLHFERHGSDSDKLFFQKYQAIETHGQAPAEKYGVHIMDKNF